MFDKIGEIFSSFVMLLFVLLFVGILGFFSALSLSGFFWSLHLLFSLF